MRIHQLQRSKGLKDKQRRLGRGNGTGTGNYSGKGLKGQKSRSGFSMKPFFEGGQTSIVQRLPKARGFTRYYKLIKDVVIINLGALDTDVRITDAMEITKQLLKDLGYIKSPTAFVKVLGNGNYAKHLKFVDMDAFSASAKDKMENPGKIYSAPKKAPVEKPVKKEVKKVEPMKKEIKKTEEAKKVIIKQDSKKIETPKKVAPKAEKLIEAPAVKKAPAKAPTTKKAPAKAPAVKKAPAKAPATKKAPAKKTK